MKLCAHALSVGATTTPVIEGLNFEITPGKILVVLGPNGSGKSTILKTLARQLKPIAGQITLDEEDISALSPAKFAKSVAYVAQNIDSKVHLSIQEYVALGRTPHQQWWQWQQSDDDRIAVEAALEATALTNLKHRPLSQLSGGEQQRAAIAIALAQKPSFMLLDEPTAHLDFKHQSELLQLLRRLRVDQNLGLVVVLHDLSAAAFLADEILLLKKGNTTGRSTATIGLANELLQGENLEQAFGVTFSTTEEAGELHYFFKYGHPADKSI